MKIEIPNTKYYKVCSTNSFGRYTSYCLYDHEFSVEYHLNQWVYPEFGKLFVFKELNDLLSYTNCYRFGSSNMFICEVINPIECKTAASFLADLKDYWNDKLVSMMDTPKGTYVCDGVKLVERIK